MSTVAEPSLRRDRSGRPARPARSGRSVRGAFGGGVLWIVVIGALLAGVVAVNVLVLRLNVRLDELRHTRAELKAEIATARAQLSSASSNERIESEAATKLGLVPADPNATTYVRMQPK
jgi:cell division protein FtsL